MGMYICALGAAVAVMFLSSTHLKAEEHWPANDGARQWGTYAAQRRAAAPNIWRGDFDVIPYDPGGNYLHWERLKGTEYRNTDTMRLDNDGLPLVKYDGEFKYNPVTIAQFGLTRYSQGNNDAAIKAADKLISMQRTDGAFPYDFFFENYWVGGSSYKPGWISGMAQAQALSLFARVYRIGHNEKYLTAGENSLAFMQVPLPEGPMTDLSGLDPSLSKYSFVEEFPTKPQCYTLNGNVFILIGLYDWWKEIGSTKAGELFNDGAVSLSKILPYYDIGSMSAYDICYVTHQVAEPYLAVKPLIIPAYQGFHVTLLTVMFDLTGDKTFDKYAKKFYEQSAPLPQPPASSSQKADIVASGSNSDGEFVRFSDGVQICWFAGTRTDIELSRYESLYQGDISVKFANQFSSAPAVTVSAFSAASQRGWGSVVFSTLAGATLSGMDVKPRKTGTTFYISYTAIGRWR